MSSSPEVATPAKLSEALSAPGVVLVDLRGETERYRRIAGAINAVWDREAKTMPTDGLPADKATPLVLFCASGARVSLAIPFLQAMGYTHMTNGGGGGGPPPAEAQKITTGPPALWETFGERRLVFRQMFDSVSSTYTYLFGDVSSGEAILVDPVVEHVRDPCGHRRRHTLKQALPRTPVPRVGVGCVRGYCLGPAARGGSGTAFSPLARLAPRRSALPQMDKTRQDTTRHDKRLKDTHTHTRAHRQTH